MYWTFDMINHLTDAPFPATIDELIEFSERSGAPSQIIENLEEMKDNTEEEEEKVVYRSIEEVWPDVAERNQYLEEADF